jgi:hypothetical protein
MIFLSSDPSATIDSETLAAASPTVIKFFEIDPESFEDNFIGSVTIKGEEITASNDDLLDLVESMVSSAEEAVDTFSSWSNGYLSSRIQESE